MVCDVSLDWYAYGRNDLMKSRVLELNASDERGIQVSTYINMLHSIYSSSLVYYRTFSPMYVCSCLSCIRQHV